MASYRQAESADVDSSAMVGDESAVWGLVQIRNDVVIGQQCIIGRGAYVGSGVKIGDRVKIQNLALVYEPAVLEDGVFIGPAVVLTNDLRPRSINPNGTLKSSADWEPVGVHVREGASIGARSVCVAPVLIGRWAMVAAGATVTKEVKDYALVAGSPARQVGWVGRSGARLEQMPDGHWLCPTTQETYAETNGFMSRREEQD